MNPNIKEEFKKDPIKALHLINCFYMASLSLKQEETGFSLSTLRQKPSSKIMPMKNKKKHIQLKTSTPHHSIIKHDLSQIQNREVKTQKGSKISEVYKGRHLSIPLYGEEESKIFIHQFNKNEEGSDKYMKSIFCKERKETDQIPKKQEENFIKTNKIFLTTKVLEGDQDGLQEQKPSNFVTTEPSKVETTEPSKKFQDFNGKQSLERVSESRLSKQEEVSIKSGKIGYQKSIVSTSEQNHRLQESS